MNLLETYSQFCGLKPQEPFIDESFYPVPFDKYIVIQTGGGMHSKLFDNWDLVSPNIKIPIIQLGSKKEPNSQGQLIDVPALPNVFDLRDMTNWNQSAYILKRALLFLGNDSVLNHMASAFNIPRIALFGATSPKTCGGSFNKSNGIEITPFDMMNCAAPCHNNFCMRPQKCINSIPIKFILENIVTILGNDNVNVCDVVHVGPLSRHPMLEWIPYDVEQNTIQTLSQIQGLITIRHDLCPTNLNLIANIANQLNLKYIVISNDKGVENLSIMPQKVEQVLLKVSPETIKEFLNIAKKLQNKYYKPMFISDLEHTVFNEHKLDMLDYPPIARISDFEVKDNHKQWIGQRFQVQTNRKVIGKNGEFFATKHDAINHKNILDKTSNNTYLNIEAEHLKELQFLILKKYE